jgi:hypothetical protein
MFPNFRRTTLEQRRMRSAEDRSTLKINSVLKVLRTLEIRSPCNAEIECTGKHAQPGASQETGKKPPAQDDASGAGQDHRQTGCQSEGFFSGCPREIAFLRELAQKRGCRDAAAPSATCGRWPGCYAASPVSCSDSIQRCSKWPALAVSRWSRTAINWRLACARIRQTMFSIWSRLSERT